jgi:hypothetical protein
MTLASAIVATALALLAPKADWQEELRRLVGQQVEQTATGYRIVDIAGEGEPLVGCIRREGKDLYLESGESRWRLTGALAVPRIAGPNYKVWIIGTPTPAGTLPAKRLGILATPEGSLCGLRTPEKESAVGAGEEMRR